MLFNKQTIYFPDMPAYLFGATGHQNIFHRRATAYLNPAPSRRLKVYKTYANKTPEHSVLPMDIHRNDVNNSAHCKHINVNNARARREPCHEISSIVFGMRTTINNKRIPRRLRFRLTWRHCMTARRRYDHCVKTPGHARGATPYRYIGNAKHYGLFTRPTFPHRGVTASHKHRAPRTVRRRRGDAMYNDRTAGRWPSFSLPIAVDPVWCTRHDVFRSSSRGRCASRFFRSRFFKPTAWARIRFVPDDDVHRVVHQRRSIGYPSPDAGTVPRNKFADTTKSDRALCHWFAWPTAKHPNGAYHQEKWVSGLDFPFTRVHWTGRTCRRNDTRSLRDY